MSGIPIGTVNLGTLGAHQFIVQPSVLTVPVSVPPGNYFLGWNLRATAPQYNSDNTTALIARVPCA